MKGRNAAQVYRLHSIVKVIKTLLKILLALVLVSFFFLGTLVYMGWKKAESRNAANEDISKIHRERDELFWIEQLGFEGIVIHKTAGLHRKDIDTITLKLESWEAVDSSLLANSYLRKRNDSTLYLFVSYSEALWPPNPIEIGDRIKKESFGFDFSIFTNQRVFRKRLSLLFCAYENPDTIIQLGNFVYGTYGSYFNTSDTLFSGTLFQGKRSGIWRYYQAHENPDKLIEGTYKLNKRDGLFRKYYSGTTQLVYEENYLANKAHGRFIWWYANGQIESKRYFENGYPIGNWEFYDKQGKLLERINYSSN